MTVHILSVIIMCIAIYTILSLSHTHSTSVVLELVLHQSQAFEETLTLPQDHPKS